MNAQNQKNEQRRPQAPRFEDVSRITRLVNQLDRRDLALDPVKRKRKWLVVLCTLFVLFLLSFLLPFPRLTYQSIGSEGMFSPEDSGIGQKPKETQSLGFEMPVDSFENLLKSHINANIPKTK
ncbi:hypothetical protein [Mangrovibacterium lignilyticum]|uniref:hypothetical protein n=1 Tax=Mangrovibacterium lignilyticum TaxID=2668052 RepID=UPI0013D3C803|nr:hypothetical protein [Mangrovibacterium lignilyticum]